MRSDPANRLKSGSRIKLQNLIKNYGRRHKYYVLNAFCAGNFMWRKEKLSRTTTNKATVYYDTKMWITFLKTAKSYVQNHPEKPELLTIQRYKC